MLKIFVVYLLVVNLVFGKYVDKRKCPEVRAVPHFDLSLMLGDWYVVEYYASAEEALEYSCMRAIFTEEDHVPGPVCTCPSGSGGRFYKRLLLVEKQYGCTFIHSLLLSEQDRKELAYLALGKEATPSFYKNINLDDEETIENQDGMIEFTPGVTMNFTYSFADDPLGEILLGNITWRVDLNEPAHWTHAESIYDGIYNTYVLDTEYKTWALLLHCAEQTEGARYLSAFVLSRTTSLPKNVMAYLRDKLPRYDVDIKYVFPIPHKDCTGKPAVPDYYRPIVIDVGSKKITRPKVSYNVAFGH